MQIFHGRPMHVEWYRHTPESDQINGESGHSGRNEPVVSVHVRFMTIEVSLFLFIYIFNFLPPSLILLFLTLPHFSSSSSSFLFLARCQG